MELSRPVVVQHHCHFTFTLHFKGEKGQIYKFCISGMEGSIYMERKGCESVGCYTHFVTFNFDLSRDWPWIFKVKF